MPLNVGKLEISPEAILGCRVQTMPSSCAIYNTIPILLSMLKTFKSSTS